MRWNNLPLWMKVLIIVFIAIVVIDYFTKLFRARKQFYQEFLNKQREIRDLIAERRKLLLLIEKAKTYANVTFKLIAFISLMFFLGFAAILQVVFNLNTLSALVDSAGVVSILYFMVTVCIEHRTIHLNNLLDSLSKEIESAFLKRFGVIPSRLDVIELRILELKEQSIVLKAKIRSNRLVTIK